MQVGFEFGALLGRIWVDFGTELGGKLEPSWHQNLKKWDTEKSSKNEHAGRVPANPEPGVCWPLRILQPQGPQGPEARSPGVQGTLTSLTTLHFVPEARWRIYTSFVAFCVVFNVFLHV